MFLINYPISSNVFWTKVEIKLSLERWSGAGGPGNLLPGREAQEEIDRLKAKLAEQSAPKQENPEVLDVPEKTIEQKIIENNNPEIYHMAKEPKQIDFRVWVNDEQKTALKNFLLENNIKFGKVN